MEVFIHDSNLGKKEGNEGLLKVTVPAEKVNKALDQAFKKVVKQINVPGFRKGKVPRPIFEQRFGVEALYQDAVDILYLKLMVKPLKKLKSIQSLNLKLM